MLEFFLDNKIIVNNKKMATKIFFSRHFRMNMNKFDYSSFRVTRLNAVAVSEAEACFKYC